MRYESQNSLASYTESKTPVTDKDRSRTMDSELSQGSMSDGGKKHKLGVRNVWRKLSRDQSSRSSVEASPVTTRKVEHNGHEPGTDVASYNSSEQDVDALFQSYEKEQSNSVSDKKEYHGRYLFCCYYQPQNVMQDIYFYLIFIAMCFINIIRFGVTIFLLI